MSDLLSNPNNLGSLIITGVAGLFIILLTFVNIGYLRSGRKASVSKNWPTTTGRVVTSEVASHIVAENNNIDDINTTMYEPRVVYEYTIAGQRYQSARLSYTAVVESTDPDWAQSVVARYRPGSSVQVYYNPAKSDDAVLEHSGGTGLVLFILGGFELFLIGWIIWTWTHR
jgi:hypothetical protein